jgi:hypothetical protein
MKISSKIFWRNTLVVLFVGHYMAVGLFACFCHNHEPDINFHENCPACQWQILSQDDFSEASAILDALDNPLQFFEYKPYDQSSIQLKESIGFTFLSRAPPTSLP